MFAGFLSALPSSAALGSGILNGPSDIPPGGDSFTAGTCSNPNNFNPPPPCEGIAGGLTLNYSSFGGLSNGTLSHLYFGLTGQPQLSMSNQGAPGCSGSGCVSTTTAIPFDAISGAQAIWTCKTTATPACSVPIRIANGSNWTTTNLWARVRETIVSGGSWSTVGSVGGGLASTLGAVMRVTGNFSVNVIYEVSDNNGTSWTPAMDYYNAAHTDPTYHTNVSWSRGFWYNQKPSTTPQTYSTNEDTNVGATLPATDADGNTLTYTVTTQPQHGVLSGTAPNLTYAPALNYNGTDSFAFKVNDGFVDSNISTISLNIAPVDDAPNAVGQTLTTDEDTSLPITLTGTDVDNDPSTLTFSIATPPSHGTLTGVDENGLVTNGGSVTYEPGLNYNGPDSFTFRASDGTLQSTAAAVNITVTPVNDAPTVADINTSTPEDTSLDYNFIGSDVEGDALTFHIVDQPSHGTVTVNGGSFHYVPDTNYNSTIGGDDSFTYAANDGQLDSSNVGTVTIQIPAVNDAPTADDVNAATPEDTPLAMVLTGADVEGSTLSFRIVDPPSHGTLSGIDENGNLTDGGNIVYTPDHNYNGPDSFRFVSNDGELDSLPATVTITVDAVNDAPVADDQAVTTAEDTGLGITLTGSDVDSTDLTYSVVDGPAHGTLSGTAPDLTYTPELNYNGTDSFTFKINDGEFDSQTATVSITITPVNDAPVADDQSVTTPEDTAKTITLTGSDVDSTDLTFSILDGPAAGSLDTSALPVVVYTPFANQNGPDAFTFTISDGELTSMPATVSVDVTPVNDAPVANDGAATTDEDTTVGIHMSGSDIDSTELTFSVVDGPSHGTLLGSPPDMVYAPDHDYFGDDSVTFKISDGELDDTGTISITVNPVNDAPVADDQSVTTPEDTALPIALSGHDVDSTDLTYSIVDGPSHGTLAGDAPNVVYTPAENYNGSDAFTFQISDGELTSNLATVSITVTPVNDAPVAVNDVAQTEQYSPVTVGVLANDSDVDNDPLSVVSATPGAKGTTTVNSDGTITYKPSPSFKGSDSFTYTITDGSLTATATVTINESVCGSGEDGIDHLHGTPADGAVSGTIDKTVEPAVGSVDEDTAATVHAYNCSYVVPLEDQVDHMLP